VVHREERRYKCALCPANYTTNNRFKIHTRTQNGERPYACGWAGCSYRVTQMCSLKIHQLTH
ncbi:hypothetical protein BC830DRAFT_1042687, partial [Chytriomyces sp. MP71]